MNGGIINEDLPKLAPPAKLKGEIREKAKLIVELLWMIVLLLPTLLMVLYRRIYPRSGKSLRGKVVLVSVSS